MARWKKWLTASVVIGKYGTTSLARWKCLTASLLTLAAGLGGMAWFAWAWHDQNPITVKFAFFGVVLTVLGAGWLVMAARAEDEDATREDVEDREEFR